MTWGKVVVVEVGRDAVVDVVVVPMLRDRVESVCVRSAGIESSIR